MSRQQILLNWWKTVDDVIPPEYRHVVLQGDVFGIHVMTRVEAHVSFDSYVRNRSSSWSDARVAELLPKTLVVYAVCIADTTGQEGFYVRQDEHVTVPPGSYRLGPTESEAFRYHQTDNAMRYLRYLHYIPAIGIICRQHRQSPCLRCGNMFDVVASLGMHALVWAPTICGECKAESLSYVKPGKLDLKKLANRRQWWQ